MMRSLPFLLIAEIIGWNTDHDHYLALEIG
jgi:hypothetical protein